MFRQLRRIAAGLALMATVTTAQAHEIDTTLVPVKVRHGRITSMTSWGLLGYGAVAAGLGGGLTIYDYRGEWFDKWKYDRVFEQRDLAGEVLLWSALGAGSAHIPLLGAGAMIEGRALRKVSPLSTTPGWIGVGLLIYGVVTVPVGLITWAPGLWVSGIGGGVGAWAMFITQFAMNVKMAKRLSPERRDELYRSRPRVQASVVPVISPQHQGARLVVVF